MFGVVALIPPRDPLFGFVRKNASGPVGWLGVSHRDQQILALAVTKLGGKARDFTEATRALREAAEELIPSGRVFFLGESECGPIIGSIISGVGLAASKHGVVVFRVGRDGQRTELGCLAP